MVGVGDTGTSGIIIASSDDVNHMPKTVLAIGGWMVRNAVEILHQLGCLGSEAAEIGEKVAAEFGGDRDHARAGVMTSPARRPKLWGRSSLAIQIMPSRGSSSTLAPALSRVVVSFEGVAFRDGVRSVQCRPRWKDDCSAESRS